MAEADFGFEKVAANAKAAKVGAVFTSVADRYDVMNDVMSLGLHRLWKWLTTVQAGLKPGEVVLDIASGSGDLAAAFADVVGPTGQVVASDINAAMLHNGRDRLLNRGCLIPWVQCDAEHLPFLEGSFDLVSVGFGLRNMTDKPAALREMQRVLKPGGRLLVLEFSQVNPLLAPVYDWYSFTVLPLLGRLIANDAASYRYLAESIRVHPPQEELKDMLIEAGLERVRYSNFSAGIVALHRGYKPLP